MKISIRPAPHSKGCAVAGREWCGKFDNHSERCENECPAGYCCEMKHCWEVGELLRDILTRRGHDVMMANKKYRKGSPESRASENTVKAMSELMAWQPDVHVVIHTNASSDPSAHGIRIGYPQKRYGSVQSRLDASRRLADFVVAENKKIYYQPGWVSSTDGYNFYELNTPRCPAIYIEGCFANSNKADAQWWHNNMKSIATSYADALEKWWVGEGHELPGEQPDRPEPIDPPTETVYIARLKVSYIWNLSLWNDTKKSKALATIKHGVDIQLLSMESENGYYPAIYEGLTGYVDKRYVGVVDVSSDTPGVWLRMKPSYVWNLSLWDDANKSRALATIRHGVAMELLDADAVHGYYRVKYENLIGYVDVRYVERVS